MQITLISHPYPYLTIEFANDKERKDLIHNIRTHKVVGLPFGDGNVQSDVATPKKAKTQLKERKKSDYKLKICKVCGKLFNPASGRAQTCHACKEALKHPCKEVKSDEEMSPKVYHNTCLICHGKFSTLSSTQQYCPECIDKASPKTSNTITDEDIAKLPRHVRRQFEQFMESDRIDRIESLAKDVQ